VTLKFLLNCAKSTENICQTSIQNTSSFFFNSYPQREEMGVLDYLSQGKKTIQLTCLCGQQPTSTKKRCQVTNWRKVKVGNLFPVIVPTAGLLDFNLIHRGEAGQYEEWLEATSASQQHVRVQSEHPASLSQNMKSCVQSKILIANKIISCN